MAAIASSSASFSSVLKYDVFLSFRGEDTRKTFTSHLYDALLRKKLEAYIDEENLKSGEEISSTLLTTIEESKLSIVVFSKNYASSRWCLNELVRIMECKEERNHIVLPVFYEIDPSDVRNQKGSYADAFLKHEERYKNDTTNKLQDWRKALTAAADLSGFDSRKLESESKLVGKIVEEVLKKLSTISNSTNDQFLGLVGMDKHLQKMESLLCLGSQDVRVIGIWGMGGIGKTTLADVVYKRFYSRFEGRFFENVSEIGLRQLEEKLFSELLEDKMNLDYRYSSLANDRLRRKKVLVVLDNVTELKQLECLLGCSLKKKIDRFGAGSRIILTSRDKNLLGKRAEEKDIYQVRALDSREALDLFYLKALGSRDSRGTNFVELSRRVVVYAQGNPLALTVLGSHLHHRTRREWESTLIALENSPNQEINQVLKMSYDVLDDRKKSTFLDIACFLIGENRDSIEEILGNESPIEISVLIEKSLITIDELTDRLSIHDLLRQMAWEIVSEESKEAGQRSRLCNAKDVCDVLENNKGTAAVKGMLLDLTKIIHEDFCLRSTVFENMRNLRFLKVQPSGYSILNINIPQGLGYLPDSLRYLVWEYCPLQYLPSNFEPQNLVILNMSCSKLKELWNGVMHLPNLKVLDLSASRELIKLPDLSHAPKLRSLNLEDCESLRQLSDIPVNIEYLELSRSGIEAFPSSFGSLKNIVRLRFYACRNLESLPELPKNLEGLDLESCSRLKCLPSNIWELKFLRQLDLSNCSRLKILPEISEDMEHLESLILSGTGIEELPSSIQNLIGLRLLFLGGCKNLKFLPEFLSTCGDFTLSLTGCSKLGLFPPTLLRCSNLIILLLGYCNISEIPDGLDSLSALRAIHLSGNNFERIPESIVLLDELSSLDISHCKNLRHLPQLPASMDFIVANDCTSLVTVDTRKGLPYHLPYEGSNYMFYNCWEMEQSARDNILNYFLSRFYYMATTIDYISDWDDCIDVCACYSGNEIPKWFSNQSEGSTTTIKISPNFFNNGITGFAACVAVEFDESLETPFDLHFKTSYGDFSSGKDLLEFTLDEQAVIKSDHVFMWSSCNSDIMFALQNLCSVEESFDFTITCNNNEFVKVKRCGIRIICCSPEAEEECPIFQEDPDPDMMSIPGSDDSSNMELPISQEDPDSDVMSIPGSDDSSNMELQSLGNNPNSEYFTTAEAEEECRISHSDYIIAEGICQDLTLSIGSHSDKMSIPGYHDCFNMELQRLGNNPNSGDSTTAERLCLDLSLSSGSQSNKIIPGHSDCSKMDLQRLGSNPNYSEYSTTPEGVCLDLSLSIGSYSYEIISGHHDCSSNLNSEGNNGCLISQLLEEPCETETINFDAEESCMHKAKCFDFCGCLSFLSLITVGIAEWKARKEN